MTAFFYIWFFLLFFPKFGYIDLSLIYNFLLFVFFSTKRTFRGTLVFFGISWIVVVFFLMVINGFENLLSSPFLRDLRLSLMSVFLSVNLPIFIDNIENFLDKLKGVIVVFLTVLLFVYLFQFFLPSFRELSYVFLRFGYADNLELLSLHSHGLRLPGLFQGYDSGSVWVALLFILLFLLGYRKLLLPILLLLPFVISSRTGLLLLFFYGVFVSVFRPRNLLIMIFMSSALISLIIALTDFLPNNSYLWLFDDIQNESSYLLNGSKPLLGSYLDFYKNGSTSDNGFEQLIRSYGLVPVLLLYLFLFYLFFFTRRSLNLKYTLFIITFLVVSTFKYPYFISKGFWELLVLTFFIKKELS